MHTFYRTKNTKKLKPKKTNTKKTLQTPKPSEQATYHPQKKNDYIFYF